MKSKIEALNAKFGKNAMSWDEYVAAAEKLLRGIAWDKRIQWENMLYAPVN